MGDPAAEDDPEPWAIFERSSPGWFRIRIDAGNAAEVYVGAAIGVDGKPVITGVAILGAQLGPSDLRQIPLGRIQAALTAPHRLDWIRTASGSPSALRNLQEAAGWTPEPVSETDRLRPRLTRPDRSDPPAFYGQVALAYRDYIAHGTRPAIAIADEASVPVATARRWINHARELGLLEKGQRGRAI